MKMETTIQGLGLSGEGLRYRGWGLGHEVLDAQSLLSLAQWPHKA